MFVHIAKFFHTEVRVEGVKIDHRSRHTLETHWNVYIENNTMYLPKYSVYNLTLNFLWNLFSVSFHHNRDYFLLCLQFIVYRRIPSSMTGELIKNVGG